MTEAAPDWWRNAVADFGAALGLRDIVDPNSEVLNLSVDNGTYLVDVERSGEDVILAVLRRVPLSEIDTAALTLLRKCSFENDNAFFVQVGLKREDVIVLAARLDRSHVYRMVEAFEFVRTLYAETGL